MANKVHTYLRLAIFLSFFSFQCNAQSDFNKVKNRIVAELMNSETDYGQIETLINTLRVDGTWPGINYQDVSRTGFEHRIHAANMVELARAYKKSGSKYNKNKKVKTTIELALKNWVDNDYFCDNWWYNQIGTPGSLVSLMLIIGDELPKDLVDKAQPVIGRANLNASGARPSGDRIKIAGILAKNLLFINDIEQFEEVIKVIEGEIKFATGRGMQYDYSFHHRVDRVNNTLSYGIGYADAFIEWAVYVTGTKYAFSAEKLNQLIDYYLDGICKTMVFGKYPDFGAKNRSISREGDLDPSGAGAPEKLLQTTNYRKNELKEIADIRGKSFKPTLSHATFYWQSEHFTFQRPDFFTSVRMYSTRNDNMEQPYNSEGLLNHHRGDGTNHISLTGKEYYDIAPVFDYQKVPGATIVQKPALPSENEIQKTGITDFVGAVTDGLYGAAVFDFKSPHDPLAAKKAWFFFDEEYVCLGAGISSESRLNVATTLNQCLWNGDIIVMKDNARSILEKGEHDLKNVIWILHDRIAYIFPDPVSVNLNNQKVSGSWYTINHQSDSPKDEITKEVFKLWLDHGSQPENATYQYIVVPSVSEQEIIAGNSNRNIEILINTPEVQAVKHSGLDITQIVFYRAGEVLISGGLKLVSDGPGLVMVKMEGQKIKTISVSDPTRKLGKIHLSVQEKMEIRAKNFKASWDEVKGISEIVIDLPQTVYAGKSVTIEL